MSKKFKVNFFINLIKLKLILVSILFWPETQIVEIVDLVDQKNSYIGTASRVMLASGNVAIQVGWQQQVLSRVPFILMALPRLLFSCDK